MKNFWSCELASRTENQWRCLGLRWQGGSRDTAFERTEKHRIKIKSSCVRKRRGASLPAAIQDAFGLTMLCFNWRRTGGAR